MSPQSAPGGALNFLSALGGYLLWASACVPDESVSFSELRPLPAVADEATEGQTELGGDDGSAAPPPARDASPQIDEDTNAGGSGGDGSGGGDDDGSDDDGSAGSGSDVGSAGSGGDVGSGGSNDGSGGSDDDGSAGSNDGSGGSDVGSAGSGGSGGVNATPGEAGSTNGGGGDSTEPPPAQVVRIDPTDGARGVSADSSISLTFSEPMNRARTEAAYRSDDLPRDAVTFSWNEDDTVLTIRPVDPLEIAFGSGDEEAEVEARSYGVRLTTDAATTTGGALSQDFSSSFAVVRKLSYQLEASVEGARTGSFRSDGLEEEGSCAEEAALLCVGDSGDDEDAQYRAFLTFELQSLPVERRLASARLQVSSTSTFGFPFQDLGLLLLEEVRFDSIDGEAFDAQPGTHLAAADESSEDAAKLDFDASGAIDLEGPRAQFRLRFEEPTNVDGDEDLLVFSRGSPQLIVSYFVP